MKLKPAKIAIVSSGLVVAAMIGVMPTTAGTSEVPKMPDVKALRSNEVKQLVLLMDTNKDGKISKQEFLAFVEAEFDRLDKDKSGQLDVQELKHSRLRPGSPLDAK